MNEAIKKNHKWQRRTIISLAVLVTAIALFYLEEDWRGKRAWEQCRTEMEAKGWVLDWDQFRPKSVPDDQNFFLAGTNILQRFKKSQNDAEYALSASNKWLRIEYDFPSYLTTRTNPLLVAELNLYVTRPSPARSRQNSASLELSQSTTPGELQARSCK